MVWRRGWHQIANPGYKCVEVFSETDQTEDLKKFDMPTLLLHGRDDQTVPIGVSSLLPPS